MERNEIALKPANAQALRQMITQIQSLNAQVNGAVNALAVALDVPDDWKFDSDKMVFVPPAKTAAPAAVSDAGGDHA